MPNGATKKISEAIAAIKSLNNKNDYDLRVAIVHLNMAQSFIDFYKQDHADAFPVQDNKQTVSLAKIV
mgnify:CR=1 FL=1